MDPYFDRHTTGQPMPSYEEIANALLDLVFLGFNSRVVALERNTGRLVWDWKSPKGSSKFVAVLLDGDRLIVSVSGYTYCLNPLSGQLVWSNPLSGMGLGIPCLASARGSTWASSAAAAEVASQEASAAAASASSASAGS
jgi:outer membrane protein assembly factor BamB